MTPDGLRQLLDAIPADTQVERSGSERASIESSLAYLASSQASESLRADCYWPKWGSPWWHMRLLHELGLGASIPGAAVRGMVDALDRMPLKIFPIHEHELPEGLDPHRHILCHCALGTIHSVLHGAGVDVDHELPWVRPWFARYQMADGGLNCDSDAYLAKDETPSSMVATIACMEAMLALDREPAFVDRAAAFLIERRLTLGSPTAFNASERESAARWSELCFPRFYFYDVLRGLSALVTWAERRDRALPLSVVGPVVEHLARTFPDGVVRVQRQAHAGKRTLARDEAGAWHKGHPASDFALLTVGSELGQPSSALTQQWSATRRALRALAIEP